MNNENDARSGRPYKAITEEYNLIVLCTKKIVSNPIQQMLIILVILVLMHIYHSLYNGRMHYQANELCTGIRTRVTR